MEGNVPAVCPNDLVPICVMCLSTDRILYRISQLQHLQCFNVGVFLNMNVGCVCWECKAMLIKFSELRERATKVQQLLNSCSFVVLNDVVYINRHFINSKIKCLSNLCKTDVNVCHEVPSIEYFKKPESEIEIKLEKEIDAIREIDHSQINNVFADESLDVEINNDRNDNRKEIEIKGERDKNREGCEEYIRVPLLGDHIHDEYHSENSVFTREPLFLLSVAPHSQSGATKRARKLFKCDVCGKPYNDKISLINHLALHDKLKCDQCDVTVNGKWELRAHVRLFHAAAKCSKQQKYCSDCDIRFKSQSGYKAHLKMSTNHRWINTNPVHALDNASNEIGNQVENERRIDLNTKPDDWSSDHSRDETLNVVQSKYTARSTPLTEDELLKMREDMRNDPNYVKSKYKCESCIQYFKTRYLLNFHVSENHLQENGIACPICTTIHQKDDMEAHIKEHYTVYVCVQCKYENASVSLMEQHYMEKHMFEESCDKTVYKCRFCTHLPPFFSRLGYRYHMRTRHKAIRFPCEHCDKVYVCRHSLKKHVMCKHTGGVPIVECEICHKMVTKFSYATHKKRVHPKREDEAFCVECNKSFKNNTMLKIHLKKSLAHKMPNAETFKCDICQKVFLHASNLKLHHRTVHLKLLEDRCEICNKTFRTTYNLKKHHRQVHQGEKPPKDHECVVCGKMFTKHILKIHMNSHTGARPYQCKLCPDTFSHKSTLYMHNRLVHLKLKKNRGKKQK